MLAYKAINTADSMIGHRSPRYLDFGRFAARLDDVASWLPARLAALLILAAACFCRGATPAAGWRAMWRDAARHRSVNAGWPEAAMAGCLGLRLAGPRRYGGQMVHDAWMGDGTPAGITRRHPSRPGNPGPRLHPHGCPDRARPGDDQHLDAALFRSDGDASRAGTVIATASRCRSRRSARCSAGTTPRTSCRSGASCHSAWCRYRSPLGSPVSVVAHRRTTTLVAIDRANPDRS